MAKRKRIVRVDVRAEVRRAMRVLRRVELSIVQRERIEKRKAAFEKVQASTAALLAEQG